MDIVWRNHGTYNVQKLWKLTNNIKSKRIYITKVVHNLNKDNWTIYEKNKPIYLTPIQVLKNKKKSEYHYEKIQTADTSFPILVYKDNDDWDVLDGLHRLAKLVLKKRKTVVVKIITPEILKKAKVR